MYARILVPIDGSPTAERGLAEALRLARLTHARLVLLTVSADSAGAVEVSSARVAEEIAAALLAACAELVDDAARRVAAAGLDCDRVVVDCRGRTVAQSILDEAADRRCDAIVMGTHGRRGLKRLALGSDAEAVVRAADVPVLLVRAPEPA